MKIDIYIPKMACFEVVEGGLGICCVKIDVYILFWADFGRLEGEKVYIWTSSHCIYFNSGIYAIFSEKRFWIEIYVACIYFFDFTGEQRKSSTAVSMPFLIRLMGRNRKVKENGRAFCPARLSTLNKKHFQLLCCRYLNKLI